MSENTVNVEKSTLFGRLWHKTGHSRSNSPLSTCFETRHESASTVWNINRTSSSTSTERLSRDAFHRDEPVSGRKKKQTNAKFKRIEDEVKKLGKTQYKPRKPGWPAAMLVCRWTVWKEQSLSRCHRDGYRHLDGFPSKLAFGAVFCSRPPPRSIAD